MVSSYIYEYILSTGPHHHAVLAVEPFHFPRPSRELPIGSSAYQKTHSPKIGPTRDTFYVRPPPACTAAWSRQVVATSFSGVMMESLFRDNPKLCKRKTQLLFRREEAARDSWPACQSGLVLPDMA